jgi:hypothetical protein
MNRNRVKRSKKNLRHDAPLSFTEGNPKVDPDPNGETPPPDTDPDK